MERVGSRGYGGEGRIGSVEDGMGMGWVLRMGSG